MYIIEALPAPISAAELEVLINAEPATIGHFITHGIASPHIKAHFQSVRAVGTAVRPGDFLVVDRCGERITAALGGAMAYAAKQAGVAGIIVDGYVTDLGEIREHGVPVWSRGASAITTRVMGLEGEFCTAIQCGGVIVHPGDAVVADENGMVFLRPGQVIEMAQRAIDFQHNEKHTLARLAKGEKFPDIVGSRTTIEAASRPR